VFKFNFFLTGGVAGMNPVLPNLGACEKVYLLQRKTSKVGNGLGKTTGWIHRTVLKNKGVEMVSGCSYNKVCYYCDRFARMPNQIDQNKLCGEF
jgi:hypothetical protein